MQTPLSIQEVHTYNNLVKLGKADPLGDPDQILVPRLLENDEVVLYDISNRITIKPGLNLVEKIRLTIDSASSD